MTGPTLVVGAGGRLGTILAGKPGMVGLARAELDITRPDSIAAALAAHRPVCVINAAAMTDVDACERDPVAADRINALAPGLLAQACAAAGAPLIHISTDYVFGGEGHDRPRRETDPPAPMNAYGRSKWEGEQRVAAAGGTAVCVRVAWLFGFHGDFLDRILARARTGAALAVTTQAGTPTPARPLADRLAVLAGRLIAGEATPPVLHLAGQPLTDRAQWVEAALANAPAGISRTVIRVDPAAFADDAKRPKGTPLDCALAANVFGATIDWRPTAAAWGRTLLSGL